MSTFWMVSAAALSAVLITAGITWFNKRRRIRLFHGQPYWAALAIVARVRRQREDEKPRWPSNEPDVLDDEPTEVLVLPPQPRPYLESRFRCRTNPDVPRDGLAGNRLAPAPQSNRGGELDFGRVVVGPAVELPDRRL